MTGRLAEVSESVVGWFVIGLATSVLLFACTLLFAYSGIPSEVLDYLNPLLLFLAGLVTCIGIGITFTVRNSESRRMWLGFTLGDLTACALVLWWLWYALGQIGS